jgi:hypothetical protein
VQQSDRVRWAWSFSNQQLSIESRVGKLECFGIELAADAQRHVQGGNETEGTTSLVIPVVIVWIEWEPFAHFIKAAREFAAGDDAMGW